MNVVLIIGCFFEEQLKVIYLLFCIVLMLELVCCLEVVNSVICVLCQVGILIEQMLVFDCCLFICEEDLLWLYCCFCNVICGICQIICGLVIVYVVSLFGVDVVWMILVKEQD